LGRNKGNSLKIKCTHKNESGMMDGWILVPLSLLRLHVYIIGDSLFFVQLLLVLVICFNEPLIHSLIYSFNKEIFMFCFTRGEKYLILFYNIIFIFLELLYHQVFFPFVQWNISSLGTYEIIYSFPYL